MRLKGKFFTVAIAVAMAFTLVACGGKSADNGTQAKEEAGVLENETAQAEETAAVESETGSVELPEAGEIVKSGSWGEGTYTLDSNGILTLSGTGKLYIQDGQEVPESDEVLYAIVEEGAINIGSQLERYSELQYVSLPSTLRSFRFMGCQKLRTVIMAEGITELENDAFENCRNLTELELPNTLERIGMRAFMNTGLTSLSLPEKMTYIDAAFSYTSLESIEWPDGVKIIYGGTFYHCEELSSITLSKDVTEIRNGAFQECPKLTDIYYEGTEEEFSGIVIGEENEALSHVTFHYLESE